MDFTDVCAQFVQSESVFLMVQLLKCLSLMYGGACLPSSFCSSDIIFLNLGLGFQQPFANHCEHCVVFFHCV